MSALIDALLVLLVAGSWLAAVGFVRLRGPLDRLHCVSFVSAGAAPLLTILGFAADGIDGRSLKILVIAVATLANGTALAHATGRALRLRGG